MSERQFQLTTRKGPQPGKNFPLVAEKIIIGRDPMSDISLNDPEVSRQHVQLVRTDSGYTLEDLGSTNGTFIDGEQVEAGEVHPLRNGQIISMGSGVTLLYEAGGGAAESDEEDASEAPVVSSPPEPDVPLPDLAAADATTAPPPQRPSAPSTPSFDREQARQTPLVPPGDSGQAKKRRRNIILAVTALLLLCCCFIVFLYTGYYYWGDPLMRLLGVY